MLVLGRKPGEYIVINNQIKVKILKNENNSLKFIIDAPKEMSVIRGELWEKQQDDKKSI